MQLLPIIIVVSLLGVLLLISFVLFVCHFTKVRARRKRRSITYDNQRPTRQLTVRSGKVVPLSQAFQTASTRDFRSLDLSTLRSGNSVKSKFSQDRIRQSPRATMRSFDRRRSSAFADPEAQNDAAETWEANVKDLHFLDERLREPRYAINSQTGETERRESISSQKITASLKKAYKGTPALETETLELPPIPGSQPAEIRTIVRKKKSDATVKRSSLIKTCHDGHETAKVSTDLRRHQSESKPPKRNKSKVFQHDPYGVPANGIQVPPAALMSRHSSPEHALMADDRTRPSFLSMSVSAASFQSRKPSNIVPPLPLVENQDHQSEHQPNTRHIENELTSHANPDVEPTELHDINSKFSNIRNASLINSATPSTATAQAFQRESMMSNSSVATFASSDISSTWTFGNAQPIAILPGVIPRATAPSPVSRRPKSKYGRFQKRRREKELPVLPRSPLSR